MDDEQFQILLRSLKAVFRAAVTDAIEAGDLVHPKDVRAMEDAVYGHVDRITGQRSGGVLVEIRSMGRKQTTQLILQGLLTAGVPIAVVILSRGS